ncbi:hypothetical protein JCM19046_3454 [Bacillus sp. JCM 19046]|nr:hypothetical protein JCM19046_3454 [Bacillus sp. JCM 19046]
MYTVYSSYIGFDLDLGNELTLLFWIFLLSVVILLINLKWANVKWERQVTGITVAMLLFLSIGAGYGALQLNAHSFNTASQTEETLYYEALEQEATDINYEISQYEIELSKNVVEATITLSSSETRTPSFQLYHAYPVLQVFVDDKEVDYERNGDIITLLIEQKSYDQIQIIYQLKDSAFIPFRSGTSILLANYAWYPKKVESQMYTKLHYLYQSDSHLSLNESRRGSDAYSFQIKADNVLFTNLEEKGDTFEGEAQSVTLLRGEGNQLTYKDYEVTYPSDWPKMERRVSEVISHWESIIHELNTIMINERIDLPNQIVFSSDQLDSLFMDDHIIYQTHSMSPVNDFDTTKDFEKNLINLAIDRRGSREMFAEWVNLTSQFIRKELALEIDLPGVSVEVLAIIKSLRFC